MKLQELGVKIPQYNSINAIFFTIYRNMKFSIPPSPNYIVINQCGYYKFSNTFVQSLLFTMATTEFSMPFCMNIFFLHSPLNSCSHIPPVQCKLLRPLEACSRVIHIGDHLHSLLNFQPYPSGLGNSC